jgi:hypothetical protein
MLSWEVSLDAYDVLLDYQPGKVVLLADSPKELHHKYQNKVLSVSVGCIAANLHIFVTTLILLAQYTQIFIHKTSFYHFINGLQFALQSMSKYC